MTALGGFLRADALSALVMALTAFVALACAIYAVGYFRRDESDGKITAAQLRRYYVLTPLFVGAMLLVPLADNLGVMWVAIESTTLASVLLVTFLQPENLLRGGLEIHHHRQRRHFAGAVRHGVHLLRRRQAARAGNARRMNWSVLVGVADKFDPTAMRLAFVMVLLGYGTKAGLAPMHTWKPDAYAEAPVPAAALLGAAFINCAIYGIMRFDVLAEKCLGHDFPGKLLVRFRRRLDSGGRAVRARAAEFPAAAGVFEH